MSVELVRRTGLLTRLMRGETYDVCVDDEQIGQVEIYRRPSVAGTSVWEVQLFRRGENYPQETTAETSYERAVAAGRDMARRHWERRESLAA
jgi:hypothetical protein